MAKQRTIEEINEKIRSGRAVVLTAEQVSAMGRESTPAEISEKVDVVTTGTFGPMCSSGMFINFGHTDPPMRMEKLTLNNVPVFGGIAAVDAYIGATETALPHDQYGGAHVIEELIAGNDVLLQATAKGTDCYPRTEIKTLINRDRVNEMIMFNPRNAYQNYNVAVNSTSKMKYTYMGTLLPSYGNATFSTSGELSPLLNDPEMRTIGIGTRIFFGGATGYVAWHGTQFNTGKPVNDHGVPVGNSATLALIGNAKEMDTRFIKAAYFEKYGVSIFVGVGIPIPVLDEDMARRVMIRNSQIETNVIDYGNPANGVLGSADYQSLFSGEITLKGRKIRTAPLSSVKVAREIAAILREEIVAGRFMLTEPVELFRKTTGLNSLQIRL
ncbi:MAG: homocysteine biosynthesis protein [Bacteroidales bacterium]|nr:homocysteine biosynthesis protein [Bacteroidales bacterium]MDT8374332.1 homocysteine biosynthesis protein [Bacteroidales bacterium]